MKLTVFIIGIIGGIAMTSSIVWFSFKPVCSAFTTYQKTTEMAKKIPFWGEKK